MTTDLQFNVDKSIDDIRDHDFGLFDPIVTNTDVLDTKFVRGVPKEPVTDSQTSYCVVFHPSAGNVWNKISNVELSLDVRFQRLLGDKWIGVGKNYTINLYLVHVQLLL